MNQTKFGSAPKGTPDMSQSPKTMEPMTDLGRELAQPNGKETRDDMLKKLDGMAAQTEQALRAGVSPPQRKVLQLKLDAVQAAKSILCGIHAVHQGSQQPNR